MDIYDWFDVDNIEHLKAWDHCNRTGHWPEGFIPEDLKMGPTWVVQIAGKLAAAYTKEKLEAAENEARTVRFNRFNRFNMSNPVEAQAGLDLIMKVVGIVK